VRSPKSTRASPNIGLRCCWGELAGAKHQHVLATSEYRPLSFRFRFIDQHTHRDVVDEVSRGNSDHRHGFVFPHVHDLPRDDFARLRFETNGGA
jgi:hypothetical protein